MSVRRTMGERGSWKLGLVVACVLGGAIELGAQCNEQELPWDVGVGALQGSAVAISGDVIVSGAPERLGGGGLPVGLVTVSRESGGSWTSSSLPLPTTLGSEGRFGHAVAIDEAGDTIVVGAPNSDATAVDGGLVTVYEWNAGTLSWDIDVELPGIFASGFFGSSVDISGEVIAVGEPTGAFGVGTVNVFRRSAPGVWTNEAFLLGAAFLDAFGWAVAVDGDRLAVGSPFAEQAGFLDRGRVEFFERVGTAWVPTQSFDGLDDEGLLGWSVALDGQHAAGGAPLTNINNVDAGLAYCWRHDGAAWTESALISTGGTFHQYSYALDLHGDLLAFGAPFASSMFGKYLGEAAGYVDVFEWNGSSWIGDPRRVFTGEEAAPGELYGIAVALSDEHVVAGAPSNDGLGGDAGRSFVRELDPSTSFVDRGFALVGASGTPQLVTVGAACGHATMNFRGTQLAPSTQAWAVYGLSALEVGFKGGVLVPAPDTIFGPLATSATGQLFYTQLWPPGLPPLSLFVQFWILDPSGPAGFSATNAMEIVSTGG